MTHSVAIVAVVAGDPARWAQAARLLRLPDPHRPTDLLPLPDRIHVEAPGTGDTAHLRLRLRAAPDAYGLRTLDGHFP